jgi:hypothetical protein
LEVVWVSGQLETQSAVVAKPAANNQNGHPQTIFWLAENGCNASFYNISQAWAANKESRPGEPVFLDPKSGQTIIHAKITIHANE